MFVSGMILLVCSLTYSSSVKMEAICFSEPQGVTTQETVNFILLLSNDIDFITLLH
jgi:hypothetical protein